MFLYFNKGGWVSLVEEVFDCWWEATYPFPPDDYAFFFYPLFPSTTSSFDFLPPDPVLQGHIRSFLQLLTPSKNSVSPRAMFIPLFIQLLDASTKSQKSSINQGAQLNEEMRIVVNPSSTGSISL